MNSNIIFIIIVVVIALGIFIFPTINKQQFNKLPYDQKVRILMKEAKSLSYFKNVKSKNGQGILYFVKNKRKILEIPWVIKDSNLICTKSKPFSNWDYPEEKEEINQDELKQIIEAIEDYNKKHPVKILFKDDSI